MLINNRDSDLQKEISVWELGVPKDSVLVQKMYSDEHGFQTEEREHLVLGGKMNLHMPKTSALVLRYAKKDDEEGIKQEEKGISALGERPEKKRNGRFSWGWR